MATGEQPPPVTLSSDNLNGMDEQILEYLKTEGRASPTLFKRATGVDPSRQYISARFVRLGEHGHIRELHDTGIYEFVEGPNSNEGDSTD